MSIGIIIGIILVVYSFVKSIYIAVTRRSGNILNYDLSMLKDNKKKEFNNYVINLLCNLTFFYGLILYLVANRFEYELYLSIIIVIITIVQDYYFIKKVFPKEYNKLRTRR